MRWIEQTSDPHELAGRHRHRTTRTRLLAWTAAAAALGLVLSPALRGHDSFPLSTYPMYTFARPRQQVFDRVVGVRTDGSERRLPMEVVAGTDDPLVAEQHVRDAVDSGNAGDLCVYVADRSPSDVATVLVVHELHDVVAVAAGDLHPLSRRVVARCSTGG